MRRILGYLLAGALGTALLLDFPFPTFGATSAGRASCAWFALVPLLAALVFLAGQREAAIRFWPLYALATGWLCGAVWFASNCSWVDRTMHLYGGMGAGLAAFSLILFSLFLGVWFGGFALMLVLIGRALRRRNHPVVAMLLAAPVLWVAMEFALLRVPSFPWDELGYSQIDNGLLTRLAPWTGVLGISLVLAAANALLAAAMVATGTRRRFAFLAVWVVVAATGMGGFLLHQPPPPATATAMLVQPNLNVATDDAWVGAQWDAHIAQFAQLASSVCGSPYFAGMPDAAPRTTTPCPPMGTATKPDLIAWPESPAPFRNIDPNFRQAIAQIAESVDAPVIVGDMGIDLSPGPDGKMNDREYNSASVVAPSGAFVGRYDKMHLVPFGEYVPARGLLFFVHQLTQQLTDLDRGSERRVFRLVGADGAAHHYGIFICYESIFGGEVRQFVQLGADVLVNISDDGWYGDTSAPWQHLAMTRMRAIENDRWLLLDTNNGVTAVIDPRGVVRQSIPRNQVSVLAARYGFEQRMTWYTAHGDLVGVACAILSMVLLLAATRTLLGASERSLPAR